MLFSLLEYLREVFFFASIDEVKKMQRIFSIFSNFMRERFLKYKNTFCFIKTKS